jgi:hypothetical protein
MDSARQLEQLSVHPALGRAFTASRSRVERDKSVPSCELVADFYANRFSRKSFASPSRSTNQTRYG